MAIKTYKKGNNTKLAANFKAKEFDCKCSGSCNKTKVDTKLVEYLQKIRDKFNKSITINSGYRCGKHNKAVGGTSSSYHTKGQAADIVVNGVKPEEVAKYAESLGIKGIGLYDSFVHIDTRSKKFYWYGHQQESRQTFGALKSLRAIAEEVIAGKWGTGLTRKNKLKKAGYDYKEVQALVNELMKK
jgi:hypothetical protein